MTVTKEATTNHIALKAWVDEWAAILKPDAIYWADGSEEEDPAEEGRKRENGRAVHGACRKRDPGTGPL